MPVDHLDANPPRILFDPTPAAASEDQCDCACVAATGNPPQAPITRYDARYQLSQPWVQVPISAEYVAVLSGGTPAPTVLNRSALRVARHFDQPRHLADVPDVWPNTWGESAIQSTLRRLVSLGLLVSPNYDRLPLAESPTLLSAWLHVTDRCNMRCAYCYLPHQPADMSSETARSAIAATIRAATNHHFSQVKLKYAGGEPLLRFPVLLDWHRYARQLADQHRLALDGVVLSNGTLLTADIVTALKINGLRLMISLDGLGQPHDQQRVYADGAGSAADVQRAIELALSLGLVPDISVTISGRTALALPELTAWLLARNLPFSFNFYRENEFSASQPDLRLEEERMIAGMLAAFAVIEANLPRRSLLASLVDRANLAAPHLRPCSVGHSYLVFDPAGRLARCQMQLAKTISAGPTTDPLRLIRSDTSGIQNVTVDRKEGCAACEWRYWCAGGCPLATFRATGRYDVKSPNCHLYQALFPAAVHLEGLRLLKYGVAADDC